MKFTLREKIIAIRDVFDIQDEITARILTALEVQIAPKDRSRVAQRDTASVGAYDELLRGLDYFGRRSPENNRLAKQHYERAIALDPGFARAYAGLAMVYARDATDGWDPKPDIALSRASELTEKLVVGGDALGSAASIRSPLGKLKPPG